jgi:hypothetical protein
MVEDPIPHQTWNLFFVTIAAIFHKRPGIATISLKVDHMHHFHKVWWQLAFYRILKDVF